MSISTRDEIEFTQEEFLLNKKQMKVFFNVLKAGVVRSRIPITGVFLTVCRDKDFTAEDVEQLETELSQFLLKNIRQTDLVSKLNRELTWFLILSESGEEEAEAFLKRIYSLLQTKEHFQMNSLGMTASIAEVNNQDVSFEELLQQGQERLEESVKNRPWGIERITSFKKKDLEIIRISVLDEDDLFRSILITSIENISVNPFQLEIKGFQDGYDFLNSEWFRSAHTHIIIMNDILPRKNGLEVLHTIRKLPNNKKFIIYMMTKRKSEEEMIFAYKQGVDEYLMKPFNLRLFEGKLRRTIERLWL
ncbi:hypothetical protein J27TS8_14580 [Robertmurraya siralis]|uniref:Response regulatory domain-containing protein n=1 Tax=Robertmurraya siralis TaxID=77777 RepID=A0A919WGG1_9BACI|nr:response regulator [Robertmurraya siralis]PAE19183.1 hypothetical protein CHH80_17430 [Bacillus sp. 7504-2]GIN61465.1 hypothetical protein J27TS8_14580 [Robertmurraya siralis]